VHHKDKMTHQLLFEIGCEELPSSFVDSALSALPSLAQDALKEARLDHGTIRAIGTPRRLALLVEDVATKQRDLDEVVMGPPLRAAYRDGQPTKAAEAFAKKIGCSIDALEQVETPKGIYLQGARHEQGKAADQLLPELLADLVPNIPFRKSMRWGDGNLSFGRPIRWLLALLDSDVLPVKLEGLQAARTSYGHRFLHPEAMQFQHAQDYETQLAKARVVVDPKKRAAMMVERLEAAAKTAGGELIDDAFLVAENMSLVEEPQVIVGRFEEEFLALPDEVILEVARGHQRYFGLRDASGRLLPRYLAVVNTANNPDTIATGNDRVMRARLADAQFFHREDLKQPLAARLSDLEGIVFQKRLGTIHAKVKRLEQLVRKLGQAFGLDEEVIAVAGEGASLCKCDLVTLMVGEFPELQGEVGRAYARAQGIAAPVADVIRDHYRPRGAKDTVAPSPAAALVAIADRLDTLVGCFSIGLSPSGGGDPYGLRRACISTLRTLESQGWDASLRSLLSAAYEGFENLEGATEKAPLLDTLGGFFRDRFRGMLCEHFPAQVVDACLGVAADRPLDARARAQAIVALDEQTRNRVGEVFKRATNIAKNAPAGEPEAGPEAAEKTLYELFFATRSELEKASLAGDYSRAFARTAALAAPLAQYFEDVLVMAEDEALRANRLRLMRTISETCGSLARLDLLAR
jgi:glycyl-tRNA synthetase beta chain